MGASFAGLAVARQLRGDVLLLDRHDVGAFQTSACGTPLWVPRALGVEHSVRQVFDRLDLKTPSRTVTIDLRDAPFCTFDYGRFARGLLDQCPGTFRRAVVTGVKDGAVHTTDGTYRARVVVDASGWRGVAVNGAQVGPGPAALSFGLETPTAVGGDRLILLLDDRVISQGIGWIFPVGRGSLIGLGSYVAESKLGPPLATFLGTLGAQGSSRHGTFFPNRLLRATHGSVFVVGDAAGQCLPLTAEGIRPALYFGGACGRVIARVLRGEQTLDAALREYSRLVERYRWAYRVLQVAQVLAVRAPNRLFAAVAHAFSLPGLRSTWWPRYARFGGSEDADRRMELAGPRAW